MHFPSCDGFGMSSCVLSVAAVFKQAWSPEQLWLDEHRRKSGRGALKSKTCCETACRLLLMPTAKKRVRLVFLRITVLPKPYRPPRQVSHRRRRHYVYHDICDQFDGQNYYTSIHFEVLIPMVFHCHCRAKTPTISYKYNLVSRLIYERTAKLLFAADTLCMVYRCPGGRLPSRRRTVCLLCKSFSYKTKYE